MQKNLFLLIERLAGDPLLRGLSILRIRLIGQGSPVCEEELPEHV
jgi:hypothetical protein